MILDTIPLSDDLLWVDEFDDAGLVGQSETISLGGQMIIHAQARLSGRPITLRAAETHGWVDRATLLALRALAADPGREMPLILRGEPARTVIFRGDRLRAEPLYGHADPEGSHPYVITLFLAEVG
jgi:hypothetical protein